MRVGYPLSSSSSFKTTPLVLLPVLQIVLVLASVGSGVAAGIGGEVAKRDESVRAVGSDESLQHISPLTVTNPGGSTTDNNVVELLHTTTADAKTNLIHVDARLPPAILTINPSSQSSHPLKRDLGWTIDDLLNKNSNIANGIWWKILFVLACLFAGIAIFIGVSFCLVLVFNRSSNIGKRAYHSKVPSEGPFIPQMQDYRRISETPSVQTTGPDPRMPIAHKAPPFVGTAAGSTGRTPRPTRPSTPLMTPGNVTPMRPGTPLREVSSSTLAPTPGPSHHVTPAMSLSPLSRDATSAYISDDDVNDTSGYASSSTAHASSSGFRSFSDHQPQQSPHSTYASASGYNTSQPAYPPASSSSYRSQPSYPPSPQPGPRHTTVADYSSSSPGYPPQSPGYPPRATGYSAYPPPQSPGYPPHPQSPGYPPQGGYSQGGYSQVQQGYGQGYSNGGAYAV